MSPKDKTLSIRLSEELLTRIDNAVSLLSDQVGAGITRNAWIERTLEIRCAAIEAGASPNVGRAIFEVPIAE